jgi:DNA polymerase-3 subunit delta
MKNIIVYYGEEDLLINNAILDIINKNKGQASKYDLSETSINVLLEDASSISLFDGCKIIIGYNADFLGSNQNKEDTNNLDNLNRYIDNPNPNSILILTLTSDKLDKRKSIVKKLMDKALVKEFDKLSDNDVFKFAKDIFEANKYQISFKALHMLIAKTGNNLYLLKSECEKLMLYKMINKIIDEQDIEEMITKYDADNIFDLTDAVIKKDINISLSLYQELIKRGEEPIKIIVMLANQFRLIFQVKRLSAKGLSEEKIASELAVHPYRVKLAKEVRLNEKDLLKYISLLADLDEGIKMGDINKDTGLELFLLKL